ncbi:MAG: hypothetical protein ABFS05_12370, partial [Bacteroidota bacterium]
MSRTLAFWIFSLLILFSLDVFGQATGVSIHQYRNGDAADPIPIPAGWTGGNIGGQNSHFIECFSIPYRAVLVNLPPNTAIRLVMGFDIKHSDKHALDFITSFDNQEPHGVFGHPAELIDPREGYSDPDIMSSPEVFLIDNIYPPVNPPGYMATGQINPNEPEYTYINVIEDTVKELHLYGAAFNGDSVAAGKVFYYLEPHGDLTLAQDEQRFVVNIMTDDDGGTAILAWGGHIGATNTWGINPGTGESNSAVAIQGSPYHMRMLDWNLGNLGNMDLSCNADAVYSQPPCDFTAANICVGETGSATMDLPSNDYTYLWSITAGDGTIASINGSNTGETVYFDGLSDGEFRLQVDVEWNGIISTCFKDITVNPLPACAITYDSQNLIELIVCPNGTITYYGPVVPVGEVYTYLWTINNNGGDASILTDPTLHSIQVSTGTQCDISYTLSLEVTSDSLCVSTCSETVLVDAVDLTLNCATDPHTEAACQTQDAINTAFALWLAEASFSGDCNPVMTTDPVNPVAPDACGGSTTVTWTVTNDCGDAETCSATFTVTAPDDIVLTCPTTYAEASCQTQADIDAAFTTWLGTAGFTGGCNATMTNNSTAAPNYCGGSATVVFTVASDCELDVTCSATFSVDYAPDIVLTCPDYQYEYACQDQTAIDAAFATWLGTAGFT